LAGFSFKLLSELHQDLQRKRAELRETIKRQEVRTDYLTGTLSEYLCCANFKLQGINRVVRKPVNANPGLKVNRGNSFSSLRMLSTTYVSPSLRLPMLKTGAKNINRTPC